MQKKCLETDRTALPERPRHTCPPCPEGTPHWIVTLREEWIKSGQVCLTTIGENLEIGFKIVMPETEFYRIAENRVGVRHLPDDYSRAWRIEAGLWPYPIDVSA
jgi:hypothetical protein